MNWIAMCRKLFLNKYINFLFNKCGGYNSYYNKTNIQKENFLVFSVHMYSSLFASD